VIGAKASDVSMGRLLAQLFEITALFDMRLRPELVLLQKTMVTVEGVARRIDPNHDIWAAAEPVVRRWILRELSPATAAREFIRDARAAVSALAKMAERDAASATVQAVEPPTKPDIVNPVIWIAFGTALTALAFQLTVLFRLVGAH
jgi:ubiquinone biosynthesis protein